MFMTELGGERDRRSSTLLTAEVKVANGFDAFFTPSGHLARNLPIDMGPSAVLRAGASGEGRGGVRVVVTSRSGPHFAPALVEAAASTSPRERRRPPASIRASAATTLPPATMTSSAWSCTA